MNTNNPELIVKRLVQSMKLKGFPMDVRMNVRPPNPTGEGPRKMVLSVGAFVKERDTGNDIPIVIEREVPMGIVHGAPFDSGRALEQFVFSTVKDLVFHELAECWYVNGERVRDPHKGE